MDTWDFSPSRLTVARQQREMTKRALAGKIGVSAAAVTYFEDGVHAPSPENLERLAQVLDFPIAFFGGDDIQEVPEESVSFRSRRNMSARVRDKTTAYLRLAAHVISPALHQRYRLPDSDIPDFEGEAPESAAAMTRSYWRLGHGPIANAVHLLEAKGVHVYWGQDHSPAVDAVSLWRDSRPFVLLNLRTNAGERARFDAAHELGHLILHRHRDGLSLSEIESEADRFASALLLPESQFRVECPRQPTLADLLRLKERWKTSIQAMVRRCRDIGIFSEWQYQSAFRDVSARGWRKDEPGRLDREESALQNGVFERMYARGIYSDEFARTLNIPVQLLGELVPATNKYREIRWEDLPAKYLSIEELGYESNEDVDDEERSAR